MTVSVAWIPGSSAGRNGDLQQSVDDVERQLALSLRGVRGALLRQLLQRTLAQRNQRSSSRTHAGPHAPSARRCSRLRNWTEHAVTLLQQDHVVSSVCYPEAMCSVVPAMC
eukprot:3936739-Rhodomonas_salina.1